jgi:hypothetical protein
VPKIGLPETKVSQKVSIPDPRADVNSLHASVVALKQTVETLAGTRGQLGPLNSDTDRPFAAITRLEVRDSATYEELRSKIARDVNAPSSAAVVNKTPGATGTTSTAPGTAFIATDLNIVPDSGEDQAANIQLAIDELNQAGGGTILFPAGEYPLYSQIVIPLGVTLAGVGPGTSLYSNFVLSFAGTRFTVYWGQFDPATTDGQRAAFSLGSGACIRDCAIDYPLQSESSASVVEYAPAIKLYDTTTRTIHGRCVIQNVFIHKAYTAIDMRGSSSRSNPSIIAQMQGHIVTDVTMTALRYGIRMDNVWTGSTFTRCAQRSPWLSRTYTTPGSSLRDYAQKNCTFLDIGGVAEQVTFTDCGAWQVKHAATFYGVSGPVSFENCTFEACRNDVFVASNNGPRVMARCVNCVFSAFDGIEEAVAGSARIASYVLSIESGTTLGGFQFSNCLLQKNSKGWLSFVQPSQSVSNIILNGCTTNVLGVFGGAGYAVTVTPGVTQCIITNNVFVGLIAAVTGTLGTSVVVNNL